MKLLSDFIYKEDGSIVLYKLKSKAQFFNYFIYFVGCVCWNFKFHVYAPKQQNLRQLCKSLALDLGISIFTYRHWIQYTQIVRMQFFHVWTFTIFFIRKLLQLLILLLIVRPGGIVLNFQASVDVVQQALDQPFVN